MSAQIIQFPTKKKVASEQRGMDEMMVCRLKALLRARYPGEFDAKPDLRIVSGAHDELNERLHRFWLQSGIIKEADH